MVGLTAEQILESRRGASSEQTTDAVLRFARQLVDNRGMVSDADLAAVRSAGWNDGADPRNHHQMCINIFTNYFNHVAETEIDFPRAK